MFKDQLFDKNTIKLLRIPFSLLLMPIYLLALSQAKMINTETFIWSFFIIHILVYPSSNGYNSYIDKDTTSIGGLANPPLPTKKLFYITLIFDILSIALSYFFVNTLFSICIFLYTLASKAYSSRIVRLKKYPIIGFLIVVFFQGGFTYYMSIVGITDLSFDFSDTNMYILLACSLQIAGAYPLTQIYQHKEDVKDEVFTLSYKLGYNGTFYFTGIMFVLCNLFYFLYFLNLGNIQLFYFLQLFFLPVIIYFFIWAIKVHKDKSNANFKSAMLMNYIAAASMNSCFLFFIYLKLVL